MEKSPLEIDYGSYRKGLQNTQIGKYVIHKKIGAGAYGTIYRAVDQQTNQTVAVKVLDLKEIQNDPNRRVKEIRMRLSETQSELMAKCNSENVLKCFQVFQNDTLKIMVIQYCNGGTLQQEIKKDKRFQQSRAILVLKQLINGIGQLHRNNIVHRDLKAENILIHNGVYKIADFGFSKMIMSEVDKQHTTLGTIITMAPEIMSRKPYGPKVDVWSIGVIFYQMLCGQLPFKPMSTNQMYEQILNTKLFDNEKHMILKSKITISPQCLDFLNRTIAISASKRMNFDEMLSHPIFEKKQKLHPGKYERNVNLQKVRLSKQQLVVDKNLDQQIQDIMEDMKNIRKTSNEKQPIIKQVKQEVVREVIKKIDKTEDQMYKWAQQTYLSCQKTQQILDEIILPLENSKILGSQRMHIQFYYLLISRCFFYMSPINEKLDKKEKIAQNLKEVVSDLYDRVLMKFQKYCVLLTGQQNKILSMIKDRFANKQQTTAKNLYLTGIQILDFARQSQIEFTSSKYIPQILPIVDKNKQKIGSLGKVAILLKNYQKINQITLDKLGKNNYQTYVKKILAEN